VFIVFFIFPFSEVEKSELGKRETPAPPCGQVHPGAAGQGFVSYDIAPAVGFLSVSTLETLVGAYPFL
jgi:hypothetical protein